MLATAILFCWHYKPFSLWVWHGIVCLNFNFLISKLDHVSKYPSNYARGKLGWSKPFHSWFSNYEHGIDQMDLSKKHVQLILLLLLPRLAIMIIIIIIKENYFCKKIIITITKNVWQSLTHSPLGVVVSPLSEYLWIIPNYGSPQCLTSLPPSKRSWTNCGNIIDASHTTSYVLNSRAHTSPHPKPFHYRFSYFFQGSPPI